VAQGVPHPPGARPGAVSVSRVAAPTLRALAAAGSVAAIAAYLAVAALRLRHPFELEWLEGGSLDQVARILAGLPLYTRPGADYAAFPYPPLYYYAAAAVSLALGPGFAALRLVSILASIGIFGVLFAFVRRETGSALAGLLAAGLFAATYRAGGYWLDVGRVDSLYLFLVALAAYVARYREGAGGQALAGALLGLAFLTKQVAIVPAVALLAHHLLWRRRRLLPLAGTFAIVVIAAALAFERATGGWFAFHVFRPHGLLPHRFLSFWGRDVLPVVPVAVAGSALFAALPFVNVEARRFHVVLAGALVATGLLSRMIIGAWLNALLPAYAALALGFGLALGNARSAPSRGRLEAALCAGAAVQLALLAWNPAAAVPTRADREAGFRLLARLEAQGGLVLVPSHPYLAARATGRGHAHAMAVGDLLHFGSGPVATEVEREIRRSICERRYAAVVTNGTWRYERDLDRHYRKAPLADLGDAFWPVSGARTRPALLYTPAAEVSPSSAGEACRPEGPAPLNNS
jgi:hypothetical protein